MDKYLSEIARYYSDRLMKFGESPQGVDWKDSDSQILRFRSFSPLLSQAGECFSVLDYGCGYGAYADYLIGESHNFKYLGIDIAESMLQAGRKRFFHRSDIQFSHSFDIRTSVHFVVCSGTFNVKLGVGESDWSQKVLENLKMIWEVASVGIAVNFLSENAEPKRREEKLFYADVARMFHFFNDELEANTLVDHSYSKWEFTVLGFRRLRSKDLIA